MGVVVQMVQLPVLVKWDGAVMEAMEEEGVMEVMVAEELVHLPILYSDPALLLQ
jgi:hypothetical protein